MECRYRIRRRDGGVAGEFSAGYNVGGWLQSIGLVFTEQRVTPKLLVKQVATGVHVDGGGTVFRGLVYLDGEPPSKKKVEIALREAGFILRTTS